MTVPPASPLRWTVADAARWRASLDAAAATIRRGGVIAYPTETLYGLAADPRLPVAVQKLFDIKGRDLSQAIPLLACDLDQVQTAFGPLPRLALRLARAFWPGPLTLLIPARASLAPALLAGGSTVAVRVTSHPVAAALASRLGFPVTSTSANLSGTPPTDDPDVVSRTLGERIDGLLDAGRTPGGPPSTIVDAVGEVPQLVRDGALPWTRVVQFLST